MAGVFVQTLKKALAGNLVLSLSSHIRKVASSFSEIGMSKKIRKKGKEEIFFDF